MDTQAWIVLASAIAFRFLECVVKRVQTDGKLDLYAIVKEFFSIS